MNSFFAELKDFETVLVSGIDAARFLQGQLTCDVHALADHGFVRGTACNNKGRIFAAFILARHGADFHVLLPNGLARTFVINLKKFIPFYKCSMQVLPGIKAIGLSGTGVATAIEKLNLQVPAALSASDHMGTRLYNLVPDNTQLILTTSAEALPAIRSSISSTISEASYEKWEIANMLNGHFPFSAEDVDKYTPQELHYDETGYVSFTKGCYTGQEIVARMHYRGKIKKRLFLLQATDWVGQKDTIEIIDGTGHGLGTPMKQFIDNQILLAIASLPVGFSGELFAKGGPQMSYQPLAPDENPEP